MKKINVILKDEETLELLEDGQAGDFIDLKDVKHVNTKYIEQLIKKEKNKVYTELFENDKKIIEANHKLELQKLLNEIELLKRESFKEQEEVKQKLIIEGIKEKELLLYEIKELKNKITLIESKNEMLRKEEVSKVRFDEQEKYNKLMTEFELLNSNIDQKLTNQRNELSLKHEQKIQEMKMEQELLISKINVEKLQELAEQKDYFQGEITKKDEIINNLQRQKSLLNNKQIGEDLEIWCDNEIMTYMQNGFYNCSWYKDNKPEGGEEGESKTKADFIFEIYATDEKKPEEMLTNICLEMKDENPNSKVKQTNKKYYAKLDEDRKKKGCKYALLVSELEADKSNNIPMYKVNEYPDMYVVRPSYLMTFLNMITSLTTRFSDIYLSNKNIRIELLKKEELINEFNKIKEKYLDDPIEKLGNNLEKIEKNAKSIKEASITIEKLCSNIKKSFIEEIENTLDNFEIKLTKNVIDEME